VAVSKHNLQEEKVVGGRGWNRSIVITIPERHTQTDGRTIYDRNTVLCTKVHRAVKIFASKPFAMQSWQQWALGRVCCLLEKQGYEEFRSAL